MAACIKDHPVYGAFFVSTAAGRFVKNSEWYHSKLSTIKLEKTILHKDKDMETKSIQRLKKFVKINHLKINSVAFLSRSFYPALVGLAAIYLDSRISHKNNHTATV